MISTILTMALVTDHSGEIAVSKNLLPGTYSNEEQVYFEQDAGRQPPPWLSLKIVQSKNGWTLTEIDAHGHPQGDPVRISLSPSEKRDIITVGTCARYFNRTEDGWTYGAIQNRKACRQKFQIAGISSDGLKLRFPGGVETMLKRARAVECWAAVPKKIDKEDGSTNWLFQQNLTLHDQGGRVTVGGGESGAEEVTLRMRAVHWPPPSTNRPSMVLYIHKDDPDRAASYSWADIGASRVGINLRWMQASCTIKDAERPSEVTETNFRGWFCSGTSGGMNILVSIGLSTFASVQKTSFDFRPL